MTGLDAVQLEDVVWLRPLVVEQSREVHLLLKQEGDAIAFEIITDEGARVVHAQGLARTGVEFGKRSVDLVAIQQRCTQQLAAAALYERFAQAGLHYGESFQVISRIDYESQEALAYLQLKPEYSSGERAFALLPNILDGALQTVAILAANNAGAVPFSLRRLAFSRLSSPCFAHVILTTSQNDVQKFRVTVLDDQGQELLVIDDFTVRSTEPMPGTLTYLRPRWKNRPLPPDGGAALHGTMLLFDDNEAFAEQILTLLPKLNVVRVEVGPAYQRRDTGIAIRPNEEADFERLVQEVTPDYIVHRWSRFDLDIEACVERGFGSIYRLTRALVRRGVTQDLPLLYVYPLGNQPAYEALHAYVRTLAQEQPKLRMKALAGGDVVAVLQELRCSDSEVEIRWSGGTRTVRTIEAFTPEVSHPLPLREQGVYLITGGTGTLGQLFAEYLAKQFRARLVLLSRSALSEPTAARFREWERAGAKVLHVQGDVSQRDDVVRCVELGKEHFGALHGIIHAAGVIRDALLWSKRDDDVWAVLQPKVRGALWLDEVTAGELLDFFALFSSVAGLTGNVGQADYAYANAFLDAFARGREMQSIQQLRHGRTVSINWPLWQEGGMRISAELAALKMKTLAPLDTATGFQIFETALRAREPQIAGLITTGALLPTQIEWNGVADNALEAAPFRDSLGDSVGLADAVSLLKRRFSQLTKIPHDRIQPWEPLEKYGVDSILVLTFTERLEQEFGPLSKTLLFEYQTLEALGGYFVAHHGNRLGQLQGKKTASVGTGDLAASAALRSPTAVAPQLVTRPRATDEVAIIGLFGRFPMADSPQEFWQNLVAGRDCIVEVPKDRWDYEHYFDPKPSKPGKTYNKWGGFLNEVDKFDPAFFRIPPREAEIMDPQERLFLETVWQTVEDAGYRKSALRQKRIGVFVGVMYGQYQLLGVENSQPGQLLSLNSSYASIANRVSYFFDWNGPSMAIDSMCSSSLTAIHLACDSIRKGECEYVIAGGVNLMLHPVRDVGLAQGGFAAVDGRCKSFGATGDGYVPGEGVGAVLLKPASDAIRDGDHIYALIKATSVNHGGKTNGYTVPNPNAQSAVVAEALRKADVDPRTITFLEAHGTGTSLGDPIEIAGLTQAFCAVLEERYPGALAAGRVPVQFCAIGSAKSNIGHLEAAAGIAGLTKVLLQLQHQTLVPSLHASTLNPHISFAETPFVVQQQISPWKSANLEEEGQTQTYPRRAGISSFGAGGSNAHLILEEYNDSRPGTATADGLPALILLSATNADRLVAVAQNLLSWMCRFEGAEGERPSLAEIAYTLQVGREPLEERLAFPVSSWIELRDRLKGFVAGDTAAEFVRGNTRQDRGASAAVVEGDEGHQFLENLIRNRSLTKLARLWVNGVEVNWDALWTGFDVKRVSLPGYAFSRERYWVPTARKLDGASGRTQLHPLLHRNESTLKAHLYGSNFSGQEVVLRDHRVDGEKVLPGAASLELAFAGASMALENPNIRLRQVVWARPVVAGEDGVALTLELRAESDGRASFELRSPTGEVHVHGKAEKIAGLPEETVDLSAIQARCSETISPEELYSGFAGRGLEYGPAFRVIRRIGFGAGEVLSAVEVPEMWANETYRLHPALADGALQSLALIAAGSEGIAMPFALNEAECTEALPKRCYAYARVETGNNGQHRYEAKLLGEQGEVLARLGGLSVRRVERRIGELLYYKPAWIPELLPQDLRLISGPVLLLDEESSLADALTERGISTVRVVPGEVYAHERDLVTIRGESAEDYARLVREIPFAGVIHRWSRRGITLDEALERGMYSVHRLVQALLKSGKAIPLVYAYPPGEVVYEAVIGYAKSLRQEQPKLRLKTVGIDRPWGNLLAELSDERSEIRYLGDQREIRTLEELSIKSSAETPLKRGGVYIVSGGAGGLGRIFAEYLVQKYGARLLLAGRSELGESDRRFLEPLGAHAIYCRADVSTAEGASQVVYEAKQRYGALNGVIHAAGELRDGLVWNKSQEDFAAVLRPKVRGVEALDAATSQEPLDYFILFSSTAGLLGNAGQSDYAYANAYLDAFAHKREELRRAGRRCGRTLSLNWPLWREGGMQGALEGTAADALGLLLLERSAGLEIFEQALTSHEVQVWGCAGDRGKIRTRLLERRPQTQRKKSVPSDPILPAASISPRAVTPSQIIDYLIRQFAEVTKLPLAQIHADEPIENYGVDSIMVTTFAQMLERDLGELSKTLLFEYPTIEALADHLLKNHAATFAALFGTMAAQSLERAAPAGLVATESVEKHATDASEDIAIIGVFGRYPQADDLDEFWANLAAGKDCIEEVPADRWNYRDHYDPEPGTPGKTSNKWGGFLKDVDKFDPLFFNISPREAQFMDPQERIFLETVWKTVEDAGYSKAALNERKVGVFVGVMYGQYQFFGIEERLKGNPISLSSSFATIANRVSYFFNWHGPSLAVDTMCSASLTSVHLACESLKRGECEFAIAGGVNTTVHPEKDIVLSQSGFSANDGRCKTFGDDGSGYVPGEGVGALLLKPLSCAEADRDHIWGVIKASSLNHGGKTNGYTVPNSKSQTEVILDTLRKAKIDPATINYIEAHGTGTVLGDPIEITGLQQAFTEALDQGKGHMTAGKPPRQFCAVGSVKSNIGHCESAAGIAGVTKLLLQLKHGKLVPSLHAERLNPNIKFEETFFRVQRRLADWEPIRMGSQILPRRAGVSSFGAGGANAHLIIEEYAASSTEAGSPAGPVLVVLSAKNTERLRESINNLVRYLESHLLDVPTRIGQERIPTGQLADEKTAATAKEQSILWDVAYTLQVGREAFEERVALKVTSVSECVTKLKAWLNGAETAGLYHGNTKKSLPAVEELRKSGSPEETVASLLRERKLDGVAELWVAGVPVNWAILYRDSLPRRVSLPTYPFARHRYWVPKRGFFDPPQREGNGEAAWVGNRGTGPANRSESAEHQLRYLHRSSGATGYARGDTQLRKRPASVGFQHHVLQRQQPGNLAEQV